MKTAREAKKAELLERYAEQEAHAFYSFDGVADIEGDDVTHPDEDGDTICWGLAYKLSFRPVDVQVLIGPRTSREAALRLLDKIRTYVKSCRVEWSAGGAEDHLDVVVCPHCGKSLDEEPMPEFPF